MFERPPVDFSRLDNDYRPDITNAGAHPTMAYVLFMDVVGFTRMPMDRQRETVTELQSLVFSTVPYVEADAERSVICRPTGDGMALVFFNSLLAPARCAVAVSQQLKHKGHIRLRMGIHSGHVYKVQDALGNEDVIGEGINTAQRVMDCGDVGHILMSKEAAALLGNLQEWKGWVQDLGDCPVKHGQMIHLYNFAAGEVGNRRVPKRVSSHRMGAVKQRLDPRQYIKVAVLAGLALAAWHFSPKLMPSMSASAKVLWQTVFKGETDRALKRAAAHADLKKWRESIAEAKAALNAEGSTPEQRGEAHYRIISAYYHIGDVEKAAAAQKGYKALREKLPAGHWTLGALRWEPPLFAARKRAAVRDWESVSNRAGTVAKAEDSMPQQRAEALYLLALAAKKQGNSELAYRWATRFDEIAPKLAPEHWTRGQMTAFSDPPADDSPAGTAIKVASDPAEEYFERVSGAYLRGDSASAARQLRSLDRYAAALRPEQVRELKRISAGIQLQSARQAFERRAFRDSIAAATRALSRLDNLSGEDNVIVSERARALYYLAAASWRAGDRERAQRFVEIFAERCATLGPDNPWSERIASVQQSILNAIPVDAPEPETATDPTEDSTESL